MKAHAKAEMEAMVKTREEERRDRWELDQQRKYQLMQEQLQSQVKEATGNPNQMK